MSAERDDEPDWGRTEWEPDDSDVDIDEDWSDDPDELETRTCPECDADVFAELEHCPVCGHWLESATRPLDGRPAWFLILGLLGVLAVIVVYSGLLGWF